ncbi:hypothetical protein [Angustibacter luteus]|uniref:Uncharacterized protein n=1 Tax=Angustibacter luteus TaxID=658456 RepID=A0ABW1JIP0_9ACTN
MSGPWTRGRRVGTLLVWAAICGFGYLAGLHPSPVGLAAAVGATSLVLWTVVDLSGLVRAPSWFAHVRDPEVSWRGDPRLTRLHRTMASTGRSRASAVEAHMLLSRVVDDRLRDLHGIQRAQHPERARPLLGPDLQAFLDDPRKVPTDPAALTALLERIEAL